MAVACKIQTYRPSISIHFPYDWGSELTNAQNSAEPTASGNLKRAHSSGFNKLIATNIVLIIVAVIAAYLQYVAYRQDMVSELETNIVLKLSFLTYQYDAVRGSTHIIGLPAFDFFQAIVYLAIIFNAWYFITASKNKS